MKRWTATVYYVPDEDGTDVHDVDVYHFDEYDELGEMIEAGPDWNEIDEIVITYNLGIDDD